MFISVYFCLGNSSVHLEGLQDMSVASLTEGQYAEKYTTLGHYLQYKFLSKTNIAKRLQVQMMKNTKLGSSSLQNLPLENVISYNT